MLNLRKKRGGKRRKKEKGKVRMGCGGNKILGKKVRREGEGGKGE